MNDDRQMHARISVILLVIVILIGFGGLLYGGWPVNDARTRDNQNVIKASPTKSREPNLSATRPAEQPPPKIPGKAATYEEIIASLSLRLQERIREKGKELDIKSIEALPRSVNEFRLWYFPSHEEMRGLIFCRNDDRKPLILVDEGRKEEIYLEPEKRNRVAAILDGNNIENLKDVRSLEFTFSPGDSYMLFQTKTGRKVVSKVYLANLGANVNNPSKSGDLYVASEVCRSLSEVLSLNFSDCRRSQ
ncbi:MAG: hypothetical protein IPJ30_04670 [Acidobacteria bacterium]|nr:hypothetical protein [Acidobacteriota bacterium]